MAYKIYFDINVLLDLTLQRKNYSEIEIIIKQVENGSMNGFVCGATIHTLSYFLSKYYGIEKTKQILLSLLSFISIIDATKEDIQKAFFTNIKDIEDAIQIQTALSFKIDYFLSYDKQLIKASSEALQIVNPKEFLKMWAAN
jgi:predicted nucleic acid-binding protein